LRIFGLTGGIASGKSTVAGRWRADGLPILDADQLAREVVAPDTDGLRAIAAAFGNGLVLPDGTLDRVALSRLVFTDEAARRELNGITHPRITRLMLERAAALARGGHRLVCYEAALIVESGSEDVFRPLVVVSCPESVQLARVMARGVSQDEALARLRAQKPNEAKIAVADYVIDGSGSLEFSATQADETLGAIRATLASTPL
jgi:dephospho-CoA kinase